MILFSVDTTVLSIYLDFLAELNANSIKDLLFILSKFLCFNLLLPYLAGITAKILLLLITSEGNLFLKLYFLLNFF